MTKHILSKQKRAQLERRELEMFSASVKHRAASVTVGTAFGGSVELSMRNNDGTFLYVVLQPVEAVELLHQMAAGLGCHIAIKPRDDFASWRQWRETNAQTAPFFSNHPPFAEGSRDRHVIGAPEHQVQAFIKGQKNETVATQEAVGRKRAKRAATPT